MKRFFFINTEKLKNDDDYYLLALIFNLTLYGVPVMSLGYNDFNLSTSSGINSIYIIIVLTVLLIYLIKIKLFKKRK